MWHEIIVLAPFILAIGDIPWYVSAIISYDRYKAVVIPARLRLITDRRASNGAKCGRNRENVIRPYQNEIISVLTRGGRIVNARQLRDSIRLGASCDVMRKGMSGEIALQLSRRDGLAYSRRCCSSRKPINGAFLYFCRDGRCH